MSVGWHGGAVVADLDRVQWAWLCVAVLERSWRRGPGQDSHGCRRCHWHRQPRRPELPPLACRLHAGTTASSCVLQRDSQRIGVQRVGSSPTCGQSRPAAAPTSHGWAVCR